MPSGSTTIARYPAAVRSGITARYPKAEPNKPGTRTTGRPVPVTVTATDSAVRVLAPLARYPLPQFLGAVALGRFPRLLLIAGVGGLVPVPTWALVGGGVALVGLAVGRRHVASAVRWLRARYRDLYAGSVAGFRL